MAAPQLCSAPPRMMKWIVHPAFMWVSFVFSVFLRACASRQLRQARPRAPMALRRHRLSGNFPESHVELLLLCPTRVLTKCKQPKDRSQRSGDAEIEFKSAGLSAEIDPGGNLMAGLRAGFGDHGILCQFRGSLCGLAFLRSIRTSSIALQLPTPGRCASR
jgi:hypothetical protein